MTMQRRTLLQGIAAGVLAAPASTLLGQFLARAAADYRIAFCDQASNQVLVYSRNEPWGENWPHWRFRPGDNQFAWKNLSDVKIRKTAADGWIALMVASAGAAGIVNIGKKKNTDAGDLVWSERPEGNPHAIERIPGNGSVVTASSEGHLTLYTPADVSRLPTLKYKAKYSFSGAHGVLWDPTTDLLWAVGQDELRGYKVEGHLRDTTLKQTRHVSIKKGDGNLGHDLQPDYTNPSRLLVTATHGAYTFDPEKGTVDELSDKKSLKSLVKHSSGEYVWVQSDNKGDHPWASSVVKFSETMGSAPAERGRKGLEIYKARLWTPDFE